LKQSKEVYFMAFFPTLRAYRYYKVSSKRVKSRVQCF